MIYLSLFITFFKIGLFTFGGGYAMISLMREAALSNAWMSEEQLLNFIAVSESTPGPFALNMATFIGSSQAGLLGSLSATLGVVMPSFIIILIVASLIHNLVKYAGFQAFMKGVRPCVVGLILSTAATLAITTFISVGGVAEHEFSVNWKGLVILAIVVAISLIYKHFKKKKPSPVLLILISAVLGIIFYFE